MNTARLGMIVGSERFLQAFALAVEIHRDDVRKSTTIPYISHPMSVCAIVLEQGGDEDLAIAALLHDAVEDHPCDGKTLERIRSAFGDSVAELVLSVTDTDDQRADHQRKAPWKDRKASYLRQLEQTAEPRPRVLAAADKLHNARAMLADFREIGPSMWDRFNATPEQILGYYHAVLEVVRRDIPASLSRQLENVLNHLATEAGVVLETLE